MTTTREFQGLEHFDEDMDIREQSITAVELGVFLDQLCGLVQITPTLDEFTRPHYRKDKLMDAMEAIDNQEITVSLNAYETAVLMKAISVYCTVGLSPEDQVPT